MDVFTPILSRGKVTKLSITRCHKPNKTMTTTILSDTVLRVGRLQSAAPRLVLQHVLVVRLVHLFQYDERQHRVGSQPHVVRREPFPETEETFPTYNFTKYILYANCTRTRYGISNEITLSQNC